MRRKILSLLPLFVTISVPIQFALAGQEELSKTIGFWSSSDLTMEQAIHQVAPNCTRSSVELLGCLQALNALAQELKPKATFATPIEAEQLPALFGKLLGTYGSLKLYEAKAGSPTQNLSDLQQQLRDRRRAQANGVAALLATNPQVRIDVEGIVNDLSPKVFQGPLKLGPAFVAGQMINAYLGATLDPHTHLDSWAADQKQLSGQDESFVGIGATMKHVAGKIIIMTPIENGPASKAGLHANDEIIAVDGQAVSSKTLDDVVKTIRGPAGTSVEISVQRKEKLILFTIVRSKISIPNVESSLLNDFGRSIGYIRLRSFMDQNSCKKLTRTIQNLESQKASALILDLRDNDGGLVDQAVCIGGLFVGQKVIVGEKDLQTGAMTQISSISRQLTNLPLVTLVNGNSASASEILSGALQDYQRSWILGERSFGKATVQASTDYRDPGTLSKISGVTLFQTIMRFYQPSGRTNQIVGINPDYEVYRMPHPTAEDKVAFREADLYSNALTAVGAPWNNPRTVQDQSLSACVSSSTELIPRYDFLQDTARPLDFQVLSAEVFLGCAKDSSLRF
jgi:C-terminal peptidase prc